MWCGVVGIIALSVGTLAGGAPAQGGRHETVRRLASTPGVQAGPLAALAVTRGALDAGAAGPGGRRRGQPIADPTPPAAPTATATAALRRPPPLLPPANPPGGAGRPDWRAIVRQYGDWDAALMIRIIAGPTAACPNGESGGDPRAVSPDGRNWGLAQINLVNYTGNPRDLLDAATNIAVAHRVWLRQGYGAWSCAG